MASHTEQLARLRQLADNNAALYPAAVEQGAGGNWQAVGSIIKGAATNRDEAREIFAEMREEEVSRRMLDEAATLVGRVTAWWAKMHTIVPSNADLLARQQVANTQVAAGQTDPPGWRAIKKAVDEAVAGLNRQEQRDAKKDLEEKKEKNPLFKKGLEVTPEDLARVPTPFETAVADTKEAVYRQLGLSDNMTGLEKAKVVTRNAAVAAGVGLAGWSVLSVVNPLVPGPIQAANWIYKKVTGKKR